METEYDFKHKFALLDVNILSQMIREKRAEKFRPVFEFLKQNNVEIFLIDATYFEFTAFVGNKKNYDVLSNWIGEFPILPCRLDDTKLASLLSSYYIHADPKLNKKQISYIDCLYAAQLVRYKERAFIVTTDIHDYPISIFDISKIVVLEDSQRAVIVAFITFNEDKWQAISHRFEASGNEREEKSINE